MAHEPVDVRRAPPGLVEHRARRRRHVRGRVPEDGLPLHPEEVVARVVRMLLPGTTCRDDQQVGQFAVTAQVERSHGAQLVGSALAQDHRPRTVTEDRNGGAVVGVEQRGERVGADEQDVPRDPGGQETGRRRECVDEPAAHRVDVEGRGAGQPELGGHLRGAGRTHVVGGAGGEHDGVDGLAVRPGRPQSAATCLHRHVDRGQSVVDDVAPRDSRPGANPLVRRVDASAELVVVDHAGRQPPAEAGQHCPTTRLMRGHLHSSTGRRREQRWRKRPAPTSMAYQLVRDWHVTLVSVTTFGWVIAKRKGRTY